MKKERGWGQVFRYKRSVPVSYDRQGYIYYSSRLYRTMPAKKQETLRRLVRDAGGQHAQALMDYVTGNLSASQVCAKYYISQSTLERLVRKYYLLFPKWL